MAAMKPADDGDVTLPPATDARREGDGPPAPDVALYCFTDRAGALDCIVGAGVENAE